MLSTIAGVRYSGTSAGVASGGGGAVGACVAGPRALPDARLRHVRSPGGGVYVSARDARRGRGHNWWCVIFPPLCAQAAGLSEQAVQALSDDDVRLVTESGGGYVVRFRLLELWDALVQRLS